MGTFTQLRTLSDLSLSAPTVNSLNPHVIRTSPHCAIALAAHSLTRVALARNLSEARLWSAPRVRSADVDDVLSPVTHTSALDDKLVLSRGAQLRIRAYHVDGLREAAALVTCTGHDEEEDCCEHEGIAYRVEHPGPS